MKVYIGPYIHYFGPQQIAEKILFWLPSEHQTTQKFVNWLEEKKAIKKFCNWLYAKRKRTMWVKIDSYDSYNVDYTLAHIIAPLLKDFKTRNSCGGSIEDSDVPEELRSTSAPPKENDQDLDANYFKRWDWALNEMIWAFEQLQTDWQEPFYQSKGYDGLLECEKRILHGTMLFGKYYCCLWD